MRALAFGLMLVASPALALDQTQIQAACYTDCESETHSNPEYKACLARAADTADLAALAGVASLFPSEQDACEAAAWVAGADGARLRDCALVGSDVRVTVSCAPRGPWVRWWEAVLGAVPEASVTTVCEDAAGDDAGHEHHDGDWMTQSEDDGIHMKFSPLAA